VWSDRPHDGVKAGEPWGGEGRHADHDVPPVAYVITADCTVRELAPDDWARRIPVAASAPTTSATDTSAPTTSPPADKPATPAVEPAR
jgi:hypothetical protein